MKITAKIDKEFTDHWYMDQVKEDMAEFKKRFTAEDLLENFRYMKNRPEIFGEIVKCETSFFNGGTDYNNETMAQVEMMVYGYDRIWTLRFYVDMSGAPNMAPDLGEIRTFVEQ